MPKKNNYECINGSKNKKRHLYLVRLPDVLPLPTSSIYQFQNFHLDYDWLEDEAVVNWEPEVQLGSWAKGPSKMFLVFQTL